MGTEKLFDVVRALSVVQTTLRQLDRWGIERRRSLALIDRAEAEEREPSTEEVREELADLGMTLDELERRIVEAAGREPEPPPQ